MIWVMGTSYQPINNPKTRLGIHPVGDRPIPEILILRDESSEIEHLNVNPLTVLTCLTR